MTIRKITTDNSVKHKHSANTPTNETCNDPKPNTKKKNASINKASQKMKSSIPHNDKKV